MAVRETSTQTRKCILGLFAHPDDETSSCAGTFTRYAHEGVEIYVATATRGELGGLGTGDLTITRDELPQVRETELRSVLQLYGAHPPILFDYRDQELINADFETLVQTVLAVIEQTQPDVILTFGPSGISNHDDHKTIHRAALEAFHRYRTTAQYEPRLYYVALPEAMARQNGFTLDATEMDISVSIDITEVKSVKINALRRYRSQPDAQELAILFEADEFNTEWFHQAYPPAPNTTPVAPSFWPTSPSTQPLDL